MRTLKKWRGIVLPTPLLSPSHNFKMARIQSRRWCVTLNNYTDQEYNAIEEAARTDRFVYCVIGKEVGESGTPHLQIFAVFFNNQSLARVKDVFGVRSHCERANGTSIQAATYCKKDNNYVEFGNLPTNQGKRNDLDDFVEWVRGRDTRPSSKDVANLFPTIFIKYPRVMELVDNMQPDPFIVDDMMSLREWQEDAWNYLNGAPDDREVAFYVDHDGNSGKSWFCRYVISKKPNDVQILSIGRREDLTFAIDETKSIFLFDVPRGQLEYLQYNVLEKLKDRFLFSSKYHSKLKVLVKVPHVMVFTNEDVDYTKMSVDRYKVTVIN